MINICQSIFVNYKSRLGIYFGGLWCFVTDRTALILNKNYLADLTHLPNLLENRLLKRCCYWPKINSYQRIDLLGQFY